MLSVVVIQYSIVGVCIMFHNNKLINISSFKKKYNLRESSFSLLLKHKLRTISRINYK